MGFVESFENKVKGTIEKYRLIRPEHKIIVAAVSGKDSLVLLHLMKKFYRDFDVLTVDQGISGYRDVLDYPNIKVISFKKELGITVDGVTGNKCTFCGVLRRHLINKHSLRYDVLVVGHNMDDELESVFMNFFRGNLEISSRLGPLTGMERSKKFTIRVKPLYFCTNDEVERYAQLKKISFSTKKCPYEKNSFRTYVQEFIRENVHDKRKIIDNFLEILPKIKERYKTNARIKHCKECGFPSRHDLCNACMLLKNENRLRISNA